MDDLLQDLKDIIFRFRDYLFSEKQLSENTNYSYYNDILQFYEYLSTIAGIKNITDFFRLEIIDEYIIYLANKEIIASSINRKLSSVSLFLKFLKIEGIIQENPSYLVERPKKGERLPIYITLPEIEKILSSFSKETKEGIRDKTLFELMYSCG
ncbi:MAG TPA: site-specific integrase, partial [Spirochaetota bacterium]|nr:site-specific integrase [Spirochaetota bacterium]